MNKWLSKNGLNATTPCSYDTVAQQFLHKFRPDINSSTTYTLQLLDNGTDVQNATEAGGEAVCILHILFYLPLTAGALVIGPGYRVCDGPCDQHIDNIPVRRRPPANLRRFRRILIECGELHPGVTYPPANRDDKLRPQREPCFREIGKVSAMPIERHN